MNIYDIAQEAGVSIATVSRVLNNKPHVSLETQNKVQAILKKNNYTPSSIARGLITNSLKLVGVIMEDIRNRQYTNTAYMIEQEMHEKGYHCLFCNVPPKNIETYIKTLSEAQVDGVIIIGSIFMSDYTINAINTFFNTRPVIIINGHLPCDNVTSILCDDQAGIMQCVDHLYEKGHRKILFVNDNDTDSAKRKRDGYMHAMFRHSLQDLCSIIQTESSFEGGFAVGEKIVSRLEHGKDYSAIVFEEDITALGCINALNNHGINVPKDVAITGFGNSVFRAVSAHVLTTVDTHLGMLGSEAVRLLYSCLNNIPCPTKLILPPELSIGNTT